MEISITFLIWLFITVGAAVGGIVAFAVRSLVKARIDHKYQVRIEELKAEHAKDLEKLKAESQTELEVLRQKISIARLQTDKFAMSQYDVYVELWQVLSGFYFTVEVLWNDAITKPNIEKLLLELRAAEQKVITCSPFLEEEHLQELKGFFETIENFYSGKLLLREILLKRDLRYIRNGDIQKQVRENSLYKEKFEYFLLNILKNDFRRKLSAPDSSVT